MAIQPKHLAWILEAAQERFAERAQEMELDIIRHERFDCMQPPTASTTKKSRKELIEQCGEFLAQYRDIIEFCREGRIKCVEASADEFSRAFKQSFKKS